MKKFLIVFVISSLFAQPLVRIYQTDISKELISRLDIVSVRGNVYLDVVGWNKDLEYLNENGIFYEVVVPDLPAYYYSRLDRSLPMGGYRTYSEILLALDSLHVIYPSIVSPRESVATGWDGYKVWAVKISDNVSLLEDEPQALLDAGIHAREVICPEVLIYFMKWLCSNYSTDNIAKYIVDNRQIWFIPLLNPDGYRRNEIDNPAGGGMWRKNTRDNNSNGIFDATYDGVDLNRNYSVGWGMPGSSSDPTSDIYRGPYPFSEPEVAGYRNFVLSHNFRTNLSYHSYSGFYLFSWGFTPTHCDDHDYYMELASLLAKYNGYEYGNAGEVFYIATGVTFDWMYSDTTGKPSIISLSPEVGFGDDGFWPPTDRIVPLCESQLWPNVVVCLSAGAMPLVDNWSFVELTGDFDGYFDPGEVIAMAVSLENLGVEQANVYATIRPITSNISVSDTSIDVGIILPKGGGGVVENPFEISISSDAVLGSLAKLRVCARMLDGYALCDTAFFTIGTPETLFFDRFCTYPWTLSGDWQCGNSTYPQPYSSPSELGTALNSDYNPSTLSEAISPRIFLPETMLAPFLEFWQWYDMESGYDGGQVRISTDGIVWNILNPIGGYPATIASTTPELGGQQAFSGRNEEWHKVQFDISSYRGDTVQIKFIFSTDAYVNGRGWYVDDFLIGGYVSSDAIVDYHSEPRKYVRVFPNPFNSRCIIEVDSNVKKVQIYDVYGRLVDEIIPSNGIVAWDIQDRKGICYPSGLYFVSVSGSMEKVLLIR